MNIEISIGADLVETKNVNFESVKQCADHILHEIKESNPVTISVKNKFIILGPEAVQKAIFTITE